MSPRRLQDDSKTVQDGSRMTPRRLQFETAQEVHNDIPEYPVCKELLHDDKQHTTRNRSRGTQRYSDSPSITFDVLPLLKLYHRRASKRGLRRLVTLTLRGGALWEASGGLQHCPTYCKYARKTKGMSLPEYLWFSYALTFLMV